MAPPKPKPKPRAELARAAAAASKWAFGTPGLSEKQQDAAMRNYEYVQNRLRETGGRETEIERRIGKRHLTARAARPIPIPKPSGARVYRPGDPEYSSDAALSAAEIQRATKAFRAPPKKRGAAILRELERQGFQRPKTEQQAQAQVKQLVRKLGTAERTSLAAAARNPLDVAGNADLVGPRTARALAEQTRRNPPPAPPKPGWGGAVASAADWVTPDTAQRAYGAAESATMGIAPDFLKAPMRNLKGIAADIAMAPAAIGETIYGDVTGKTQWAVPKMLKEGLIEWGKGIERATPLPADLRKTIDHIKKGEFGQIADEQWQDLKAMQEEWTQRPFTAALNVYPAASGAARAAEFPGLVRSIAKANPEMSRAAVIRAARKESFVPGYGAARGKWKGGIPKRILSGKLVGDDGQVLSEFKAAARPPSRGALGRKIQGGYDKWSRSTGPLAPGNVKGLGRFTELRRAARSLQRKRTLDWEQHRTTLLRNMEPLETYIRQSGLSNKVKNLQLSRLQENRARLAETFYGPQGPPANVHETLTAVAADLQNLAREGGLKVPTNKLGKIDKELRRVSLRLEQYGKPIHLNTGMWAQATDVMREAGYSQEQIEVNLELASAAARAWAKRDPERDPNDWLTSPEGRNVVDIRYGTPDADALGQSLFQVLYPGDADIPEWAGNPYRLNRAAAEAGEATPVPPPFSTGPAVSAAGRPLATHTTRHGEASRDIRATVDVDGNPIEGADPALLAKVQKQLPQDGRYETTTDGDEVWVGRTTLQQKHERMLRFFNGLDGDQQELFRRWYERTWDYVAHIYGEDAAQQMGNAFYASQAAQSPAGGIAMLFRIAQEISEGKKLSPSAGFIQKNVWKLMEGEHLGENPKGLAAKLMDFFDSGAGMNMRSLLEGMSEGGPGVVDRWTWRSDGYITPEKGGKAPDMMRARVPGVEADSQLKSTTGKTYGYEYSSMRLQELTTRWNRNGVGGRRDWTIDQIQAIDWFATKQDWVAKKFTPTSAEGGSPLDMALENTREVSFAGTPEQLRAAVDEAGAGVEILRGIRGEGRTQTDVSVGPEGGTQAIVIGAPKVMNRLEETLGKLGQTYSMRYPGQFGGTATQRRHQIDVPRSRRGEAGEAVGRLGWKKKDKPLAVEMGEDTVRLDFGTGKTGAARARAFADDLGIEHSEITPRFSVAKGGKPTVLQQRSAEGIRGAVEFLDTESGKQIIYLAEHADASTFVHELFGHAAHEMRRELPEEFAAVEKRYGSKLEDWTEEQHEQFAREAERFFMTGKAPIPELQPIFTSMRAWMKTVYDTIKALGKNKINPETEALLNRYFGKEPLDFTPPKRLRRGLPQPGDIGAVSSLVDETSDLLMRGPDVLAKDPARRLRIAGNMKWLEQQVLPYVNEMDSRLAERVNDLFRTYDDVKSGSSIFSPDERGLLEARGKLMRKRHGELRRMEDSLRAQPDAALLEKAREAMDDLDKGESLEDIANSVKQFGKVVREVDNRTQGDFERQRLLERQVKDLKRALDPDRKVNKDARDEAVGVLRAISDEMTDIYMDVFGEGLSPEALEMLRRSLDVRANVLPTRLRELKLLKEGTGSGSYMPHYSIFDKIFSQLRGPVRLPAAGRSRKRLSMKVRSDQMTFGKGTNKLVRYGTGELQVDPRALLSAYKQRLRFVETSALRKQLFQIGVKIPKDSAGNPRIPEGWYILNGSGKAIPKRLERLQEMSQSEIDELLASGQDFDSMLESEAGTMKMLEEYRDSWLAKEEGGQPPPKWDEDNLRMLPPEVVETMVGKVFESTPGGFPQSLGGLVSTAGRVATIFSHPIGYIHANVAANAMLLAITNPARLGRAALESVPAPIMTFLRTPVSLRSKHPALYEDITVQTGDVKAEAGIPSFYVKEQTGMERVERAATQTTRGWAGFLGNVADQPFRVASWTGHARKYGYTTPEQWRALLDSTDPEEVHAREIISQRAREDMLDFNKLSPQEQRMSRYLFIWPFIRAAAAQPAWLVREYPARMAALSQAAQAQEAAYAGTEEEGTSVREKYNAVMPAADRSMFDLYDVPAAGGTINMNPITPTGPFVEKVSEAYRIAQGDFTPVGDVFNPGFTEFAKGVLGDRGMDWEKVMASTVPGASFIQAALKPKKRGAQKYTDRDSFWDYFRRREWGRTFPEDVDPEQIRESGKKEAEKADKRPSWEKAHEEDMEDYEKIVAAAVKKGKRPPNEKEEAAIKRSIAAYNALDQADDAMKEKTGKTDLDERDRITATYEVVKEYFPEKYDSLPPLDDVLTWPMKKTDGANDIPSLREDIRAKIRGKRSKLMSRGRDLGLDVE